MPETTTVGATVQFAEQLERDIATYKGTKKYGMLDAYQRAFHLLPPEERLTAFIGDLPGAKPSIEAPRESDPNKIAQRLIRYAAALNAAIYAALEDGHIDRTEREKIIGQIQAVDAATNDLAGTVHAESSAA